MYMYVAGRHGGVKLVGRNSEVFCADLGSPEGFYGRYTQVFTYLCPLFERKEVRSSARNAS